jgi:hypothetical protein
MNASIPIILAAYSTLSVLIAIYAFRVFRRRHESVTFCTVAACVLLFTWPYPAVKLLTRKLAPKKIV